MANRVVDMSQPQAARVAGFGILIIALLALFANFFVLERLIAPGDAARTAEKIMASEGLFRAGISGLAIVVVLDVVVALALYVFLKPVNNSLALLAAWFRVAFATIFGLALLGLVLGVELLGDDAYLTAFEPDQLQAQVMIFLDAFSYGWLIGLVFFGFHFLAIGSLILKSDYVPRILGVLLIVASVGYLVDSFANFLLPNYADYETIFLLIVAVPGIIAELSLAFWLLLRGANVQPRDNRDLESA